MTPINSMKFELRTAWHEQFLNPTMVPEPTVPGSEKLEPNCDVPIPVGQFKFQNRFKTIYTISILNIFKVSSGVVGHHTNFTHLRSRVRVRANTKIKYFFKTFGGPRRAEGPGPRPNTGHGAGPKANQATCTGPNRKYTG